MSERIVKLNKLFKEHLGEIFQRELSLKPGVFLTIAKVDTTPDLRYTRVSISVFPFKDTDYAMKTLAKEIEQKTQNASTSTLAICFRFNRGRSRQNRKNSYPNLKYILKLLAP
ncbi:MAG: hypothetical protein US10_C0016G0012 [Candidatus Moranbacteria bacterium GW2011_GWD2_36_198]|nr:MAG: hypothetical protein US10_C0016G0012 [Candidatus Moranbacteria bacterium GW2011_GWD2_36_198]